MTTTLTNSLLGSRELPDFKAFDPAEVKPAIATLIADCESALETATSVTMPVDYRRLCEVLDVPLQALDGAWGTVMHLQSVKDTPALRDAVAATQPLVTAFYAKLSSSEKLYDLSKRIEASQSADLTPAERRALANNLRGSRLAGAELAPDPKARFVDTQQRLAALSREFSNHLQDGTDEFAHFATREELAGVPEDVLARFAAAAKVDGKAGSYKITLQQPSIGPVMQFARNRELRAALYCANATRASEYGPAEWDNGPVIQEILALRQERAGLLDLGTFADVSLVPKMAETPAEVIEFLRDMARRARPQAVDELEDLRAFARDRLSLETLEPWDMAFATEMLRQERYAFSEQEVKQYFSLDDVIAGMFDIAQQLFGVTFHPEAAEAWHPTVTAYRVERAGELVGRFLLDPFSRNGKKPGAWMNGARPRWRRPDGQLRHPLSYLVTNFAEPAAGQPTLLRHGEVVTLFHEFGHGLHFLLTEVDVLGVSGISGVEWDAVELPSQLMENFAWQWPVLQRITTNPTTGQSLPRELFDKMTAARTFQVGLILLRQVELALFDMRLHAEPLSRENVQALFDDVRAEVALVPVPEFNRFQNGFLHVFAGGYAAGYYSYLWAEVLASDAWDAFEQAGAVDNTTGQRYLDAILSRGGSRPMRESFEAFRGRQPTIDALLRQRGLLCAAPLEPAETTVN